MSVTIREIADAAGVSRGTVDRALNDRPGIKPEIAAHVKEVAARLGYQPNLAAKMLSAHRYGTSKIGIILTTENNAFFDEVLFGVKAALQEFSSFGISNEVKILNEYDAEAQLTAIDNMVQSGCNGIVLTPVACDEVSKKINALDEQGIKVVTINTDITDSRRLAYVGCHHTKSGEALAGLLGLMANGRPMNIGIIGGTDKNLAVKRRTIGFVRMLQTEYPNVQIVCHLKNEDNDKTSFEITKSMIRQYPQLDAICIMGAGIVGTIQAVSEEKQQGKQIRLFVYDLIDEVKAGLLDATVDATITQEPFRQGYDGVQLLAKYLAYNQLPEAELNYTDLAIVTRNCL